MVITKIMILIKLINLKKNSVQHEDISQSLIDKGIVDENYIFTKDWSLSSPSLAASIVVGYSINGRSVWKDKKGVSLKEQEMNN